MMLLEGITFIGNPDITIQKHTDNSIARRTPGIRQLATRYNEMRARLLNHPLRRYHKTVGIPAMLDIDQLFNTEANQEMWLETGLTEDDLAQPARYLHDEGVRSGVVAMLMRDRAEEECSRLESELKIMINWITSSLMATEKAILLCNGKLV